MKSGSRVLLVVLGIFLLLAVSGISKYNNLVTLDENVKESWAQVENVYQRRADLIPNLVSTVKGSANFEKETLEAVVKARASATSVSPEALQGVLNNPQAFQKFEASQNALGSALSRLLVTVEKYPDLKSSQNYLALQSQLEGSENRIAVERKRFNEEVLSYNTQIRRFPGNIMASFFGFTTKEMFKSVAGSEKAPEVKF